MVDQRHAPRIEYPVAEESIRLAAKKQLPIPSIPDLSEGVAVATDGKPEHIRPKDVKYRGEGHHQGQQSDDDQDLAMFAH